MCVCVCVCALQLVPPIGMLNNPMNAVTTKFVRTSTNKVKCPVFVIRVRDGPSHGALSFFVKRDSSMTPTCLLSDLNSTVGHCG